MTRIVSVLLLFYAFYASNDVFLLYMWWPASDGGDYFEYVRDIPICYDGF